MRCPVTDPHFADNGVHGAEAQRRLVVSALRHGAGKFRRAVDAGAHIGTWTVELASRFLAVEAFEPDRENFTCLEENCKGMPNVQTYHLALGRSRQRGRVMNLGANSGCPFIVAGGDVEVVPLDQFDYQDVDFLKIDVEGMEGEVLLGAERTLVRCKPAVFFEDNGLGPVHYGSTWRDPKDLLSALGYSRRARVAKNELWVW